MKTKISLLATALAAWSTGVLSASAGPLETLPVTSITGVLRASHNQQAWRAVAAEGVPVRASEPSGSLVPALLTGAAGSAYRVPVQFVRRYGAYYFSYGPRYFAPYSYYHYYY